MPKATKKTAAKPAKSAAKKSPAKKAAPVRKPAAARPRATTAAPARVVIERRAGASKVVGLISSVSNGEIALQAYYIAERRRNLGLPGDPQSDWLEAERQLRR
jgi:hypothetical protein